MRIQILPLPSVVVGEVVEEPFALIVDEFDGLPSEAEAAQWSKFAKDCGARAVAFSGKTVDVVNPYISDLIPDEPSISLTGPPAAER